MRNTGNARALERGLARILLDEPTCPNERMFHDDLRGLEVEDLRVERNRLRLGLAITEPRRRPWWAVERLAAIDRELAVRRG